MSTALSREGPGASPAAGVGRQPDGLEGAHRRYPAPGQGFQIPHHDGAGEIDAVGPGVDHERVGQRVWVWMAAFGEPWGTAAQWTVVPEEQAMPLPDGASLDLGASLGVPAMTACRCLFTDGAVRGRPCWSPQAPARSGTSPSNSPSTQGPAVLATVSGPQKAELASKAGADVVELPSQRRRRAGPLVLRAVRPGRRGRARLEPEPRPCGSRARDGDRHVCGRGQRSDAAGPCLHDGQCDAHDHPQVAATLHPVTECRSVNSATCAWMSLFILFASPSGGV